MTSPRKDILKFAVAATAGFSFFWLTSHPKSSVHKKIKQRRVNLYLLPHIKIETEDKEYHLHHWINLTSLYVLLCSARSRKLLGSKLLNGFIVGGILQGLCYKDRFDIVNPITAEEE